MQERKRIAVIMNESESVYQQRMLKGIITQAYSLNWDVAVFSCLTNYYYDCAHQTSEHNIFALINYKKFDGLLYARSTIRNAHLQEKLDAELRQNCRIPIVLLDEPSDTLPYVLTDDRSAFRQLTEHFITVHGMTDIYCLTGFQGNPLAEQRVTGYRQALKAHGIPYRQEAVFYGDFWSSSGEQLGARLVNKEIPMPQAIVCANDAMAIALCNYLTNHGIQIPEQVAISGYDATPECQENLLSMTSFIRANYELGVCAVSRLYTLLMGKQCTNVQSPTASIVTGRSCGCGDDLQHLAQEMAYHKKIANYEGLYKNSNMAVSLTLAETIDTCMNQVYSHLYMIRDYKEYYLCLCEDWAGSCDVAEPTAYRKTGFPENITIKAVVGASGDLRDYSFPAKDMLPALVEEREEPRAYYFTPLHHNDRFFGYSVISYGSTPDCYDEIYCRWNATISTAIEFIRVQNFLKSMYNRVHLSAIRDSLTGIYNQEGFRQALQQQYNRARDQELSLLVMIANIDDLRQINDTYGHLEGDNAIIVFSNALTNTFTSNERCARLSGDQFAVVGSGEYDADAETRFTNALNSYLEHYNHSNTQVPKITASLGFFCGQIPPQSGPDSLVQIALNQMEQNKLQRRTERSSPYYAEFSKLREKIYATPSYNWSIDAMCKEMILSRGYFQKLYTRCFGISFTQDVINSRIAHAKKLLAQTDQSIAVIAEKSGYDNYVHFMHQFKKIVGITPTDYRRKKRQA